MRNKIYSVVFCIYILIFAVGFIFTKNRSFSDMENRTLAKFPTISSKNLFDGEYDEQFDKYATDHMIGKDFFVKLKVETDLILNKSLVNGVYFSKDNMLIQEYKKPYNQLSKNILYVNDFANNNSDLNITWLVIPNACYIYQDKLPVYAPCYDQKEVMTYIRANIDDNINYGDCTDELKSAKDEYIFYKTDHHFTMNGAYIGYKVLCDMLDIKAKDKTEYNIEVVNEQFLGSQYSNAPTFGQEKDTILFYVNSDGKYTIEYYDTGVVSNSLYERENLNKKDKYTAYLGGNHPYIKITSNSDNNEKILVVKDSYAHTVLPLLADNYSEIHVVDLRYYHESVSELARQEGIDKIILINNLEFLSTDNNFLWLQ